MEQRFPMAFGRIPDFCGMGCSQELPRGVTRRPRFPTCSLFGPSALGRNCPACRSSAPAFSVAVDGQLAPSTGVCPSSTFRKARFSCQTRDPPESSCAIGAKILPRRMCGQSLISPGLPAFDGWTIRSGRNWAFGTTEDELEDPSCRNK